MVNFKIQTEFVIKKMIRRLARTFRLTSEDSSDWVSLERRYQCDAV